MKSGKCIIVSAPSGAGKTTIVRNVLQKLPQLRFSVSATSRAPRSNERDGVDYYFITATSFREKVAHGDFLEWEEVYPNQFYGTLKQEVERIWNEGHSVIFDLDVEGGAKLKTHFAENALAIFIQPPSIAELENRLRKRSTETEQSLRTRVDKARHELTFSPSFDKVIVNDDLLRASEEALAAIKHFLEK